MREYNHASKGSATFNGYYFFIAILLFFLFTTIYQLIGKDKESSKTFSENSRLEKQNDSLASDRDDLLSDLGRIDEENRKMEEEISFLDSLNKVLTAKDKRSDTLFADIRKAFAKKDFGGELFYQVEILYFDRLSRSNTICWLDSGKVNNSINYSLSVNKAGNTVLAYEAEVKIGKAPPALFLTKKDGEKISCQKINRDVSLISKDSSVKEEKIALRDTVSATLADTTGKNVWK